MRPEQNAERLIYTHRIHRCRRPKCRIQTRKKLRKDLWKRVFSFDDGREAGGSSTQFRDSRNDQQRRIERERFRKDRNSIEPSVAGLSQRNELNALIFGARSPEGSGDSGKCEDAVRSACHPCRDIDPARSRVRIRQGGGVRQPETSGTCGVRTKVWAGMGSAEIAKAEVPPND